MRLSEITGISIHAFTPYAQGGEFVADLSDYVSAYSHELSADIGCASASISLSVDFDAAQNWYAEGLGRRIEVYNQSGKRIWKGIVNLVTVSVGNLTGEARGPLMEIGNRVSAVYTPIDVTVYPPVTGSTTVTTINENQSSQSRYGIIEKVLSAGTAQDADAERARDTYLAENSYPKSSGEVNPDGNSAASVVLDCIGNYYWFDAYVYNAYDAGFITVTDKIKAILAADPNFILTSTAGIRTNAYITVAVEDQSRFASSIIADIVKLGDANDNRWLFGVDADGIPYYNQVPTDLEYEISLADERQVIHSGESEVYPWNIRAGRWIMISDWLSAYQQHSDRTDPRRKFIETVRYTAPYSVSITDGQSGTITQLLAKLGA